METQTLWTQIQDLYANLDQHPWVSTILGLIVLVSIALLAGHVARIIILRITKILGRQPALHWISDLRQHNLARLLRAGLCVTVNSDDPAYFGGYVAANYLAVAEAHELSRAELVQLAAHSFAASFVAAEEKAAWQAELASYAAAHA